MEGRNEKGVRDGAVSNPIGMTAKSVMVVTPRGILPRQAAIVSCVATLLFLCGAGRAATPLTTVRVAAGFTRPLFVTAPPQDTTRLFVVEQRGSDNRGRVKIVKGGVTLATPFLTTDVLATDNEQGLLGLAFAPDFATSHRFYVYYTDSTGAGTLERRTVTGNPDVADAGRTILLTVPHPFTNHNGGWLAFGPDGYLYVSEGDGGSGGDPGDRAQNINEMLGKMLRLDVSGAAYTSPPTNPFAGATPGLDPIWAFGLRNPWRPSFDRVTGDFIIADVGQSQVEEINFIPAGTGAGTNFGWRCFEGSTPFTTSTTISCGSCSAAGCPKAFPAYQYTHVSGRCSITGGYVYRGCDIPDLEGTYFFADYCSNEIWSGQFHGGQLTNVVDRTAELAPGGGLTVNSVTSFGEDARGELYICDQGGEIFKIVPKTPVQPSDMPTLRAGIALGDTLGATSAGNALVPGVVPFADAGSRISGVGYLRDSKIRDCADLGGGCLSSAMRLDPFDIDLTACVDSTNGRLTRQFVFTNAGPSARALVYVDVLTPLLRGDPDNALVISPAGAGGSAVLAQYDFGTPQRWMIHQGVGGSPVVYSSDVDTSSQLVARVAADQPLTGAHSAGPQTVGMALGFDFGVVAPGSQRTVTMTTTYQASAPTGVEPTPPPVAPVQLVIRSPMPFRNDLRLEIGLPQPEVVRLDVFDLMGRRVRTLLQGATSAGRTPSRWDGRLESGVKAASGIYFLRLHSASWSLTRRIALVR